MKRLYHQPHNPMNPAYHASRVAEEMVGENSPTLKLAFKAASGALMVYMGARMFGGAAKKLLAQMSASDGLPKTRH